jgi:hypothetical protein
MKIKMQLAAGTEEKRDAHASDATFIQYRVPVYHHHDPFSHQIQTKDDDS